MEKRIWSLIVVLSMLIGCMPLIAQATASAEEGIYGDLSYEIIDNIITITDCDENAKMVEISAEINGLPVTRIGDYAFSHCDNLTSVTIPNSVISIGDRAFYACSNLINITIPDSTVDIGYCAFESCLNLRDITIPDSVTKIGYNIVDDTAYYKNEDHWINNILYIGNHLIEIREGTENNYFIKEGTICIADSACYNNYWVERPITVTIPDSVISIGDRAFWSSNLASINVDDNNKIYSSKDGSLFNKDKTELIQYAIGNQRVSYSIPNSVIKVNRLAFNKSALTQIIIPNSVTHIGEGAFYACRNLTTITIPNSVIEMGEDTFRGCSSLISVTFNARNCMSNGSFGFDNCTGLTSITIGEEVTNIPRVTFENCTKLTTITIPSSVSSIGIGAFHGCSELKNVIIQNGVKSIGDGAFENCISLTNIAIPNSVINIGLEAFKNCSSLTSVNFNAENCAYDRNYYEYPIFNDCTSLAILTIGEKVTSIPDYMFKNCTGLKKVNFNAQNITYMSQTAFINCPSLTTIIIGEEVITIPSYAFRNCSGVTNISIPNSIIKIGNNAFDNCHNLKDVYYSGTEEQWRNIIDDSSNLNDATIHYGLGKTFAPTNTNPSKPNSGGSDYIYGISGGSGRGYKKTTDVRERLKNSAENFNKAALEYTAAISKAAQKQAGTVDDIEVFANKLETKNRILFTNSPDSKTKHAAYIGYAKYLNQMIEEGICLNKINLSDNSIMIDYKLTSQILSKLRGKKLSYEYKGYTIKINSLAIFKSYFGTLDVFTPKGGKLSAMISSDTNKTMADLQDFASQLKDVAQDANKQALRTVVSDLVNLTGLGNLGAMIARDGLKSYKPLTKLGYGDVVKNVKKCYSGYEAVKGILNCTQINSLDSIIDNPKQLVKKINNLCEYESNIENAVVNAAQDKLIDSLYNLLYASQAYEEMRNGKQPTFQERIKDFFDKTTSWISSIFQCPVDFTVYDENGEMIGYVDDGAVYYNDDIYIEVNGDVKTLYVPVGMKVDITMTGTDEGEFHYIVEEVIYNQPTGRLNYYGLPLSEGMEYTQNLDTTEFDNCTEVLPIASQDGDILPNEYISAEDTTAYVIINANSNNGGTVLGGGEYAKGDSVELSAVSINSNYEFNGWYIEDELVSVDNIYRFTAIENTDIHAAFMRVYNEDNAYEMQISDTVSDMYSYVYKDSNSSKGIVLVPFTEEVSDNMQIYVTTYAADDSILNNDVLYSATLNENGIYAFENIDLENATKVVIKDENGIKIASADYDSNKDIAYVKIEVSDKYSDSLNVTAREELGNVIVNFDILDDKISQEDIVAYLVEHDENSVLLNCTILNKITTENGIRYEMPMSENSKLILWTSNMLPITEVITLDLLNI